MKIQIEELNNKSGFDYCRFLMATGHPPSDSLEVYRGSMLSYTISPISWGASVKLREKDIGGFSLEKYKKFKEWK